MYFGKHVCLYACVNTFGNPYPLPSNRRDLQRHIASGACVHCDYGSIPDAYSVQGDGGFVRGRKVDDAGDSLSEDSLTSSAGDSTD